MEQGDARNGDSVGVAMTYYCATCKKECEPQLWANGEIIGASCCEESPLMVEELFLRPLTESEMTDVAEALHKEADAERTPQERRAQRRLDSEG